MKRLAAIIGVIIVIACGMWAYATFTSTGCLVIDDSTGLEWSLLLDESVTWTEATATAASLTRCGYNDWRLPTEDELLGLVDEFETPQITALFQPALGDIDTWTIWTSDADPDAEDYVPALQDRYIIVYFETGGATINSKPLTAFKGAHYSALYVRPEIETSGILWAASGDTIIWETGGDNLEWD